MTRKIQHKRGLEANLPQLDEAEIAFTTDSKKPFIGSADGNVEIAKKADVDEKASKTELTNAVSPKADKTYVDTELGKKASTDEVSAVSAQLADKASSEEVHAIAEAKRDKSIPITQNDISTDLLQAISDTPGVPINVLSEPKENSVTPRKTTFLKTSTNLFNPETADIGYSLDASGNLIANASFAVSDFIDGKSAFSYSVGSVVKVGTYDEAKNYLGAATLSPPSMTTREGTRYFKVIFYPKDINKVQVNEGSTLLPYERYYVELKSDVMLNIRNIDLEKNVVTGDKTSFVSMSPNLHNEDGHVNKTINNSTGELADSVGHKTSDFVYLEPGQTKITDNFVIKRAFYDYKYKFLSMASNPGTWPHTTTIPDGARYERHVYSNTNAIPDKMLNYGEKLLPYEDYYARVFGHKLVPENFSEDSFYVVEGVTDGVYSSPVIPEDTSIASMTASDLHALYDDLTSRFPHYITKSDGMTNAAGELNYRYEFKPTSVPTVSAGQKMPKMIIVSGVHNEKMGAYSLYQTMRQICELWETNELLETLRWNVHFIIVPVVNPYAFNGGSRKNPNGVDIARNFSAGWMASSPTSESYGGVAPLSEVESQYVDQIIRDNRRDTIYFTSFHNFFTNADVNNFIWNASATQYQVDLAKKLISKMSRKWKKEYAWLPQDETTFFGFADRNAPPGSEGLHAASYGIQGSTFEVCETFMLESGATKFSSLALTLGAETFINWLILNLKYNI